MTEPIQLPQDAPAGPGPGVPRVGCLLSQDLLFTSKVTGTARLLGTSVVVIGSPAEVRRRLPELSPALVLVDLAAASLADPAFLAELGALAPGARIVAFGSHVDTAALKRAAEAGCHEVMPRSRFVQQLPELIRRALVD